MKGESDIFDGSDTFDGSDISDTWTTVASETGLAGSARRTAIAQVEREIRHGKFSVSIESRLN